MARIYIRFLASHSPDNSENHQDDHTNEINYTREIRNVPTIAYPPNLLNGNVNSTCVHNFLSLSICSIHRSPLRPFGHKYAKTYNCGGVSKISTIWRIISYVVQLPRRRKIGFLRKCARLKVIVASGTVFFQKKFVPRC